MTHSFNSSDLKQFEEQGIDPALIERQLEQFKTGFPPIDLVRSAKIGDGVVQLSKENIRMLTKEFEMARLDGRMLKFVPASGAASRMFQFLAKVYSDVQKEKVDVESRAKDDKDYTVFLEFAKKLDRFAFYNELNERLAKDNLKLKDILANKDYKTLLQYLLTDKGLNFSKIPKGLVLFHQYSTKVRTAFEEQIVEAVEYAKDKTNTVRLHFTVSEDFESQIKKHIEQFIKTFITQGLKFEIGFSVQKSSTDTIAVDEQNTPLRDPKGKLLFRPGGHGALIENLNDLKADIVFIKNIDNIAVDKLKPVTYEYKKALAGFLVNLQKQISAYLNELEKPTVGNSELTAILNFAEKKLLMDCSSVVKASPKAKQDFLNKMFNRPIRVCGVVKNQGEPGGGPFWVKSHSLETLQIIESSQVRASDSEQEKIWKSSTHFNPVDLVCGVRDFKGKPFDLKKFIDPQTGFISTKSKDGKALKALELPGLWNGAMADWITLFVEVPLETFNPVKTVMDLLRPAHRA